MPILEIGSNAIPYSLRRSRRALRLRITVRADGVEVVAPVRTSAAEIREFVDRHGDWVARKVSALRLTLDAHPGPRGSRPAAGSYCAAPRSTSGSRSAPAPGSSSTGATASRSGCPSG